MATKWLASPPPRLAGAMMSPFPARGPTPPSARDCAVRSAATPPFLKYSTSSAVSIRQVNTTFSLVPSRRWMVSGTSMPGFRAAIDPADVEALGPDQVQRLARHCRSGTAAAARPCRPGWSVDALEGFADHGLDAQQADALGCPVARAAGAVFLTPRSGSAAYFPSCSASPRRRSASALVRLVVMGEATLDARHHLVLEADVGEGAAHHHHLVIAAARAVLVEVLGAPRPLPSDRCRPGCPCGSNRRARCGRW